MVSVGSKSNGQIQTVSVSENTEQGVVYRVQFAANSFLPTSELNKIVAAIMAVKQQLPQANITYVEANNTTLTVEFYDAPVFAILVLVTAIVVALSVVTITVLAPGTVQKIIDSINTALGNPVFALVVIGGLIVLGLFGVVMIQQGQKKSGGSKGGGLF